MPLTLKDKITSLEDYMEVMLPTGFTVRHQHLSTKANLTLFPNFLLQSMPDLSMSSDVLGSMMMQNVSVLPTSLWWMHREHLRIMHNIYPTDTMAVQRLRGMPQWAHFMPHSSASEPGQIAFTPTAEYGVADRQVTMALGRFLKKTYLALSDPTIARIEARHRLELNPDIRFIVCIDEPAKLLAAYCKIQSCMAKPISAFPGVPMHPVHCYCAPGWQLAVLYTDNDHISARSMTWINPNNPKDKRMVRTYGDAMLHNWLLKQGYELKTFQGAKMRTKLITAGNHLTDSSLIVSPYVDTGPGNGQGIWDGAETVTLRDAANSAENTRMRGFLFNVQNQSGKVYAKPFVTTRLCAISGRTASTAEYDFVVALVDDQQLYALASVVKERGYTAVRGQANETIWVPVDTPTFMDAGLHYLDTPGTRHVRQFVQLDVEWYPEERHWIKRTMDVTHSVLLLMPGENVPPPRYMLINDAMQLIVPNVGGGKFVQRVYRSMIPPRAVQVNTINGLKTYAAPGVEVLRTAGTNRKVVMGVHDVCAGWDLKYHFTRNMRQMRFLDEYVYVPKTGLAFADYRFDCFTPLAEQRFSDALVAASQLGLNFERRMQECIWAVFGASLGEIYLPSDNMDAHTFGRYTAHGPQEVRVHPLNLFLDQESYDAPRHLDIVRSQFAQQLWNFGRLVRQRVVASLPPPTVTDFKDDQRIKTPGTLGVPAAAVSPEVCEPEWVSGDAAPYSPLPLSRG